jgi:hypothetical protein
MRFMLGVQVRRLDDDPTRGGREVGQGFRARNRRSSRLSEAEIAPFWPCQRVG